MRKMSHRIIMGGEKRKDFLRRMIIRLPRIVFFIGFVSATLTITMGKMIQTCIETEKYAS